MKARFTVDFCRRRLCRFSLAITACYHFKDHDDEFQGEKRCRLQLLSQLSENQPSHQTHTHTPFNTKPEQGSPSTTLGDYKKKRQNVTVSGMFFFYIGVLKYLTG